MMEMSTTRGVSFDPAVAAEARIRTEAERKVREEQEARQEAQRRREERRAEGRMLDQIELSYRQHRVPQSQRFN